MAPTQTPTATKMVTLTKSDEQRLLHDSIEHDLVEAAFVWMRLVGVIGSGTAAVVNFATGHEPFSYVLPSIVCTCGILLGLSGINAKAQMAGFMAIECPAILSFALSQGCTASLVPAIYGFIPCACGFIFRTSRALVLSSAGVLAATCIIFAVDLSGHCPSEPMAPTDTSSIVSDRFVPLIMLIGGNCAVLIAIVNQSQKALLLQTKAAITAAELAKVRKDVLHRVTHELRTPLNGIVGSVELLTTSETLQRNEDDMENAATIKRCLETMLRICDDVLLAANSNPSSNHSSISMSAKQDRPRMEGKNVHAHDTPFLLVSCIDKVVDIFGSSVAAKGLKLKVEFVGDTTCMVSGIQEIQLNQVILNLVGNALKFTEAGSITLRLRITKEDPASDVLVCAFEVDDTGIGACTESSQMLFEPFHQGEQGAVSRRHQGTGLGLSICRELVKNMGGTIAVDTAPGQGARFFFTLHLRLHHSSLQNLLGPEQTQSQSQCGSDTGTSTATSLSLADEYRISILDSEKESSASCKSVVTSIAPLNAVVTSVDSPSALLDLITKQNTTPSATTTTRMHRFVFMERSSMGLERRGSSNLESLVRSAGWLIFEYSDYHDFSDLVANSTDDVHGIFRRPLPLERMGEAFRDALTGGSPSSRTRSKTTNDNHSSNSFTERANDTTEVQEKTENPTSIQAAEREIISQSEPTTDAIPAKTLETTTSEATTESPGTKIVVVDDTHLNVKVLVKLLSRFTSIPILSRFDGQSAIELVEASSQDDILLILMDWHMPGVCGLTATEAIRRVASKGGPNVYLCMVTADIEGLQTEMERRHISFKGTVSRGELVKSSGASASEMKMEGELENPDSNDKFALVDIVTGKPVNLKAVRAILDWFQEQLEGSPDLPRFGGN